jgi:hypothetical protein
MAYYAESKSAEARGVIHLEGLALDGRRRILDFLRQIGPKEPCVEENATRGTANPLIRVSGPELRFALGLFEDNEAFLARSLKPGATAADHLTALEQDYLFDFKNAIPHAGDVLTGYNPPWVKAALNDLPPDACGFLLGEIPADWRQLLTESLKLRVCPRTFVLHLKRAGGGVAVSLTLSLDRAGEDLVLKEDLEKWRRRALDDWKARFPPLKTEAGPLALVGLTLNTLRWGVSSGSVKAHVLISDPTWKALSELLNRAAKEK